MPDTPVTVAPTPGVTVARTPEGGLTATVAGPLNWLAIVKLILAAVTAALG